MKAWDFVMMAAFAALGGGPAVVDGGTVHGGASGPAVAAPVAAAPADGGVQAEAVKPEPVKAEPPKAAAMAPEVKALVDRMQAFYEGTTDFTAGFRQDYAYKTFKRTQTSTGKVAFKKPALMRWDYETPSKKTFVLTGEKVYAHDPAAMTLTKGTIGSDQLSASVTFLWGKGKLADEFAIARVDCAKCTGTLLELTPLKPDPRFKKVRLEVDPKTAQVRRSIVIDPDGSENAITFTDLKPNTGMSEEAFKLAPPANTQIIDMTR